MLKLIKVNSKNQIWEYFQNTDVEKESWIVSKASDRDYMSQHILSRDGCFLDLSVQWHRSFYRMVHERTFPEFKIVSREFAEVFLRQKLLSLKQNLDIDVVDEKSRLRSITYYAALLFDPDLDETKLEEWLNLSDERKLRLKPDLLLNRLFLSFFLENRLICEDWIVAQLQTADLIELQLPMERLHFDLGSDYGMLESSLLQKLAKNHDVILFQTIHAFDKQYEHLIQAYERFDKLENKAGESLPGAQIDLRKFSSAISESRFAVGQIKIWSQHGVPWQHMAIVAPDIRKYSDLLQWQLLAEDIPVNQTKNSTYLEFQDVRELLSDLSFLKSEIEFSSVKASLARFSGNDKKNSFPRIEEKLNSPFLSSESFLNLVQKWLPGFFSKHLAMSLESLLSFREIEVEALEFVRKTEIFWERAGLGERKEKIINALFDSSSPSVKLLPREWVEQIEKIALQSNVTVNSKDIAGIQLTSLSQVSLFNQKNVFVLGLDEGGFASQFKEAIPPEDIFTLGSELGVYLAHPDLSVNSFLLEDLLTQVTGTVVMSYPYKAIDSRIQNPAQKWQTRAFDQKLFEKETDLPKPVFWDWLMSNPESQWMHCRQQEYKIDVQNWDSKPDQVLPVAHFSLNEISLSPSSIQTFLDCRQKFYFQRVLRLKSVETESFDVNARDKGSWYHSIFEQLIAKEDQYILPLVAAGFSDADKLAMLARLQTDFAAIFPVGFSETTWNLVKKSYFENVIKFIEHEIKLRSHLPELKSVAVEWPWEIYYDWKRYEFSSVETDDTVKIAGVIDRILLNTQTNHLWLVDYKSSLKNYSSYIDWIGNKEFQLLLYNYIVQNHSKEPWAGKVENLSYWQLPDFSNKKGFAVADPKIYDFGYAKKTIGTIEDKEKVEAEFLSQFQDMITEMRGGHFYPNPVDEKKCQYCEWRLSCRAPHL